MKRIIFSVTNDLATDNRVNRSCIVAQSLGFEVLLVGRKLPKSQDVTRSYAIKRFRLIFKTGVLFYAAFQLRLFFYLLFKRVDILYSNDLDTLLPNYLISKLKRTPLIYDSHELFTEVPELEHSPFKKGIWAFVEKRIIPKLKHCITVNESLAAIFEKKYGVVFHVIRNVPERITIPKMDALLIEKIPSNSFKVIIQGSGLNVDRGIEEAVLAMKELEGVTLMLVGDGDVMPIVKDLIQTHHLDEKVKIYGRRPYLEMMQFTVHADLGLTLDKPLSKNYEFSLPNKVFDYMHAGTPILASKLVEIERVINTHHIGSILAEVSPEAIAFSINELKNHPDVLAAQKEACFIAANTENWENEQKKLISLLQSVLS